MSYTVSRKIHFQNSRRTSGVPSHKTSHRPRKTIRRGEKPKRKVARTQRISKLMALAIHFEQILIDGHVQDMATLARYGQVSRARMTQIMNLLNLAPDIQETILYLPKTTKGREFTTIQKLNTIALKPDWTIQRAMWSEFSSHILPK